MKTVKLLLVIVWFGLTTLSAQTIQVEKRYALFSTGEHTGTDPVFNQDGDLLAFSPAYGKLAVYDFSDQSVTPVGGEELFDPIFSADSKKLMYKNVVYRSRLRYEGVKSFDLQKKEVKQMLAPEREVRRLSSYDNGLMLVRNNKMVKATYGKATEKTPPYVWSDGVNLNIYMDGKHKVLNPVEDVSGHIWASLSPDETKIMFTAVGRGTYICDLQGNVLSRLGFLHAPVWYDNDYVVGTNDEDDGYLVTSSEVVMLSTDGRVSQRLSLPGELAFTPTVAKKAGKVAYSTQDGGIYIVELNLTK